MRKGWTCWGSICGGCGVLHRTEEAARKHCAKEQRDVQRGHPGGSSYTDMRPCPSHFRDGKIRRIEG